MPSPDPPSRVVVSHCERCLESYGDSYLGVGWTKSEAHALTRYRMMLDVIRPGEAGPVSLLDFGCGLSGLYEYMLREGIGGVRYAGLDLSERFLALSRAKFPGVTYHHGDALQEGFDIPDYDYVVLNGVFTAAFGVPFAEMFDYLRALVVAVFAKARVGIAFNVASAHVDAHEPDLFHVPFDELAAFLVAEVGPDFAFRHDYGLHEYTCYAYRWPDFGG
ncbi:MAG: class I SAM-dependent methyltransferase [Actinomycetota bacterium]|nr:class I SAM-dependent methyltransferase [Actinomycetota bacterium]